LNRLQGGKLKSRLRRDIFQFIGIVFGAMFFAMGYSWFLIPYKMVPGGVGGLSQIFYHYMGIPVGISMITINIPLFIVSFFLMGPRFGVRSFYGMIVTSLMTDFFDLKNLFKFGFIDNLEKYHFIVNGRDVYAMLSPQDVYLSAIAGSVLLGMGLGLIFRFKGSTGGTDIPVAVIKQKTGLSIGTGYWIVETAIILIVGFAFHDLKLVIWGYINLFITTKITDIASEGLPYTKGAWIISEYPYDIRAEIFKHINRGVTFFKAEGGFTDKKYDVIFCVINRRQVSVLRDIVKDIDPEAFMILTDVNDVMGYGFKSRILDLRDN